MKAASLKWKQLEKKAYSFELVRVCHECPIKTLGPFQITVDPDKGESRMVYLDSGKEVPQDIKLDLPNNVEEIFDKLEKDRRSDISYMKVDYHPSEGYPTRFAMSRFSDTALIMGYIKNVRVLKKNEKY